MTFLGHTLTFLLLFFDYLPPLCTFIVRGKQETVTLKYKHTKKWLLFHHRRLKRYNSPCNDINSTFLVQAALTCVNYHKEIATYEYRRRQITENYIIEDQRGDIAKKKKKKETRRNMEGVSSPFRSCCRLGGAYSEMSTGVETPVLTASS